MKADLFKDKANIFDKGSHRIRNVDNIAKTIRDTFALNKNQQLMDFGSGTGLLLERIAPYVAGMTAIDVSPAMNAVLAKKRQDIQTMGCELTLLQTDLTQNKVSFEQKFDGIISSMTLHHIADIDALFAIFYELLADDGFIALADLDKEDGSFHSDNTGVEHFGFDRADIEQSAKQAGFKQVKTVIASTFEKPNRDYDVFLLTAQKG